MAVRRNVILAVTFLLLMSLSASSFAAPVPSKTASEQTLSSREADLALVQSVVQDEQIAAVLARHGFTPEQVNDRLSRLSDQELRTLSQNIDQLQAAGLTNTQWKYVLIGAVAVLLLIVLL